VRVNKHLKEKDDVGVTSSGKLRRTRMDDIKNRRKKGEKVASFLKR